MRIGNQPDRKAQYNPFVLNTYRMPNGVAGGMMQPGGAPQRPPMQPGNPNINLVTALTQPGPNKVWAS